MSDNPAMIPKASLSWIRHELRNPLNLILGYSEMLQEEAEEEGLTGFLGDLQKIQMAGRTMLSLINEHLVIPADEIDGAAVPVKHESTPRKVMERHDLQPDHGSLLLVDDNEGNRDILSRQLEKQGYTVSTAEDGFKALEKIKGAPFDLVLLDIIMPGMDGYQVLEHLKEDRELRHIPVIMISALDELESVIRCIERGADDYLPKPFDPVLLRARIGASLEKKRLRDQEQLSHKALVETQNLLNRELSEAADYVRSLLPPMLTGDIETDWRFIPSTSLGGDAFGYHWLDSDHFVMYLLDVCGHGVGAALLSISVMNVLRSQSLPSCDFLDPAAVLGALNLAFQMEQQNNMYFTIWYGVYDRRERRLVYASGGHPPAVFIQGPDEKQAEAASLESTGSVIGWDTDNTFENRALEVQPFNRLLVFSDGTYELTREDGSMLTFEEYLRELSRPSEPGKNDLDRVVEYAVAVNGSAAFADDFSLFQVKFR
ncbi:MAG: SpoIIE family protein phosphatase [Candidatus Eremiobacteraeota bacterium]|nr:SpoIIE family protein phosphatase [Candidatus Eremiobacteraeota bacterium]